MRLALRIVVTVGLLAPVACSSSDDGLEPPRPGTALERGIGEGTSLTLPPGQEVIVLVRAIVNTSDGPLELEKVRAIPGEGVPESLQVVQVAVVPKQGPAAPGTYVTSPPIVRGGGRCRRAFVRAAPGITLDIGHELLYLVWVRALAEGNASLGGLRATYEQAGTTYVQDVPIPGFIEVTVADDADALRPSEDERACADVARFLPGAVTF